MCRESVAVGSSYVLSIDSAAGTESGVRLDDLRRRDLEGDQK